MNYLAIRNEVIGTRFDSSQDPNVKNWVTTAYAKIWNAADWQFKKVVAGALPIVAGNDKPVMPTAFNDISYREALIDQNGVPLYNMMPQQFEAYYRSGKQQGITGQPEAFTVVNAQIILGPTPSVTTNFALSYDRSICHFLSDGITVTAGGMSADTDLPFWSADHHMVIVYGALEIGQGIESDIAGFFSSSLYTDALAAMRADEEQKIHAANQWPVYNPFSVSQDSWP